MAYPPPPYADATCGVPLCGEAITGAWWAYPASAPLLLGGFQPELFILLGEQVPSAGLVLVGWAPEIRIDSTLAVPTPGLTLGSVVPSYRISSAIVVTPAGLLLGAVLPTRIGISYLFPIVCLDLELAADPEAARALVASPTRVLILDPLECR